jgi:hypothetical protein
MIPSSLRLALAASLLAASGASAQTHTWNFGDDTAPGGCTQTSAGNANGLGNVYSCSEQPSGGTATLRVSAFTASGATAGSTFSASAVTPQGAGSGFGVGSAAEGGRWASSTNSDHALDNNGTGGSDLLLLDFLAGPQQLRHVALGWTSGDADFQVLRWTGAAAPTLAGQSIAGALGAGWQLVSTVAGVGNTASDFAYGVNASGLASRYWMISTYNGALGTSAGFAADATADRMKVLGVATSTVPEPSTYALLAGGLAGIAAVARRRRA